MSSVIGVKITGKRKVSRPDNVYDLTVQGNHNLFVRDKIEDCMMLAHNCSMDVQSVMAIHELQHKMASCIVHEGGDYLEHFHNYVLHHLSCTTHSISTMEHRGIPLSETRFLELLHPKNSPLKAKLDKVSTEMNALPEVIATNKYILEEKGLVVEDSLFADCIDWVFNINKEKHIQHLFFDILGIEYDDSEVGTSGRVSVGKNFQGSRKEIPAVVLYGEYKKYKAVWSTYVKGWYKKMQEHPDSSIDWRIRPGYSYLLVTGRSNSFNPNLQNVPQHHKASASFVKELMVTPLGYIGIDADYSSHEVRCWGMAANDPQLAKTFITSLEIIYDLRADSNPHTYERWLYESDTHKINYSNFTGVPIREVTKEQRQDSKGITFGSMYGIGDRALASSINKTLELTKKIKAAFFKRFSRGGKYMKDQCDNAASEGYVTSMLGRRRNLIGHKVPVPSLQAAFERRAQNSPIQGVASDFGYIASRLFSLSIADVMERFDLPSNVDYMVAHGWGNAATKFDRNPAYQAADINSMVHDSIKSQDRYDLIYVALHLKEWAMTRGVSDYVKEHFGVKFNVDLGIEIDIGATGATMEKWEWASEDFEYTETKADGESVTKTVLGLDSMIINALKEQKKMGYPISVNSLMKEAKGVYKTMLPYLNKKYPLPYNDYIKSRRSK